MGTVRVVRAFFFVLMLTALLLPFSVVFASPEKAVEETAAVDTVSAKTNVVNTVITEDFESKTFFFITIVASVMLALTVAALGCGNAQGKAIVSALESIARQPESAGKIQNVLLLGLAFIESLVIYILAVGIMLLYADPFLKYFKG
jgi:F-type H+-transporting ATPase subunit c